MKKVHVQNISTKLDANTNDKYLSDNVLKTISSISKKDLIEPPIFNSNYMINLSIDSIHISSTLNPYDIKRKEIIAYEEIDLSFTENYNFKIELKTIENYKPLRIKKYTILIEDNLVITVKNYKYNDDIYFYEFGGLSQYQKINSTVVHILRSVYKQIVSISEIHFAFDIFAKFEDIHVNPIIRTHQKTFSNKKTISINTYYKKKKKWSLCCYDKLYQMYIQKKLDGGYSAITRMELKLFNAFLCNRKLKKIFRDDSAVDKLESKIKKIFLDLQISHEDGFIDCSSLKIKDVLKNFIDFLNSDTVEIKTHYKKLIGEVKKQQLIIATIKKVFGLNRIQELLVLIDSKKTNIYQINKKSGVHRNTVKQIVDFLRTIY